MEQAALSRHCPVLSNRVIRNGTRLCWPRWMKDTYFHPSVSASGGIKAYRRPTGKKPDRGMDHSPMGPSVLKSPEIPS